MHINGKMWCCYGVRARCSSAYANCSDLCAWLRLGARAAARRVFLLVAACAHLKLSASACAYVRYDTALRAAIAGAVADVKFSMMWVCVSVEYRRYVVCAPTVVSTTVVLRVSVSMGSRLISCEHAK